MVIDISARYDLNISRIMLKVSLGTQKGSLNMVRVSQDMVIGSQSILLA
jgi:hypothetical protein